MGQPTDSRGRETNGDDDALVLGVGVHGVVGGLGNGVDVRGHLETVLALVRLEGGEGVDTEVWVRTRHERASR